jgi:hypothetical protein
MARGRQPKLEKSSAIEWRVIVYSSHKNNMFLRSLFISAFLSHMYWSESDPSVACTLHRTLAPKHDGGIANYKVSEEAMSETDDAR